MQIGNLEIRMKFMILGFAIMISGGGAGFFSWIQHGLEESALVFICLAVSIFSGFLVAIFSMNYTSETSDERYRIPRGH